MVSGTGEPEVVWRNTKGNKRLQGHEKEPGKLSDREIACGSSEIIHSHKGSKGPQMTGQCFSVHDASPQRLAEMALSFFFQMHKSQQNKHTKKWENVAQSKEQKKSIEILPKTEGLVNYAKIFCVR